VRRRKRKGRGERGGKKKRDEHGPPLASTAGKRKEGEFLRQKKEEEGKKKKKGSIPASGLCRSISREEGEKKGRIGKEGGGGRPFLHTTLVEGGADLERGEGEEKKKGGKLKLS